jgi:O-antigen/teichoic acid export membrane protein
MRRMRTAPSAGRDPEVRRPERLHFLPPLFDGRGDSLLRNSMFIMATTVLTAGLGAVFWIAAARLYPTHAVGLAAALVSAMALTSILSTFGIQGSLVHRLPRRRSGPEWSATVTAGLAVTGGTSVLGAGLLILALPLLSPRFDVIRAKPAYAAAFAVGVVLTTVATALDYTFIAERASGAMLARNGVLAFVKIPLVAVPPLVASAGALGILGSWVIASLGGVATALALVHRLDRSYRLTARGVLTEMRAMVPSLPAQHTISVAAGLPTFALPLLVAARVSADDTAHFYTTWMVGSLFFIISPAVSWALFAEGRKEGADLDRIVRRGALFTAALLAPLMVAFLLGGHLVLSLFGPGYADEGTVLLTILVVSAAPDAITNLFVSAMRIRGTLRPAILLNLGMAGETLVLAWILLPRFGVAGAGWAWLVAQASGSLFAALYVIRLRTGRTGLDRVASVQAGGQRAAEGHQK